MQDPERDHSQASARLGSLPTDTTHAPDEGKSDAPRRVAIEAVQPEVDGGRFAAKRIVHDLVEVTADVFAEGHDVVQAALLVRRPGEDAWVEHPMEHIVNDRFEGSFVPDAVGRWHFTVIGWTDAFGTWVRDLRRRVEADAVAEGDLLVGAAMLREAARRRPMPPASGSEPDLLDVAEGLEASGASVNERAAHALDVEVRQAMARRTDRAHATRYRHVVPVQADPERARASAWYELFPRSTSPDPGRAGTLRDVIDRLPYVAGMGFDVLYLPPIHPVGRTARKGPNNRVESAPGDPGSPWAIGGPEGGHTAIHPELGDFDDFDALVSACGEHGLDLALDLAFQCSPDHPWVREHPEWFRHRPDGSIQYAENPPKRYQDIYPLDFETAEWRSLWQALRDVVLFWCDRGVRIFRVDNPHTKPFAFWEWLIEDVRQRHPETLFLAEAFTRPKVMYRLAKLGFTHSYTYFAWRNQRWEIEQYFEELARSPAADHFRPHLWPNTPDILTEALQHGGRGAFMARLVLAATLSANYGIYGPVFESMEARPVRRGSEEYLDSEKYQVHHWAWDKTEGLQPFIRRMNRIRRENPALYADRSLRFHHADDPQIVCYSKRDAETGAAMLVVVNLDPHHVHAGWVHLDLAALGLDGDESYQVHDLLTDSRFLWHGGRNYVSLDPHSVPAHVFRIRRRARDERDFEYYL